MCGVFNTVGEYKKKEFYKMKFMLYRVSYQGGLNKKEIQLNFHNFPFRYLINSIYAPNES